MICIPTLRSTFGTSRYLSLALAAATLLCLFQSTAAADTLDVVRVEEDWELVLNEPADVKTAPQLETVMTPFGNLNSIYARVTWNYREMPDFHAGGMQLQAWYRSRFFFKKNFGSADMSTVSETVTWTQIVETDGDMLTFQVKDGKSVTWGTFGGSSLTLEAPLGLDNLNSYNPQAVVDNSGISFGANRVVLFRIKQIRYYGKGDVLLGIDTDPKVVHPK